MNRLIFNKMNIKSLILSLLLIGLLAHTNNVKGQNINIPNKEGPMGLQVNTFTGNLFFSRTDVFIPGVELDLDISFSYNAYNFDINRGFGNGWSFEYDIFYSTDTSDNIVISYGDGSEEIYKRRGNGSFQSPLGFFNTLTEFEPGKFSLKEVSGLEYLFENNSNKKITKMITPNGNFVEIGHSGPLITSITNNFGQTITLSYNGTGQLTSVEDAITTPTRTWTYEYDPQNNLTKVTDPLGAFDRYTYLPSGPMQTVSDKNLNVVDVVYFKNFAVKEMVGCNKRLSFSYDSAQLLTVVTDYMQTDPNQVTKYYYENSDDRAWLAAMSGNCCGFDLKREYDDVGNVIKEIDGNGNETTLTYDDLGNILTETNALGQTITNTYIQGTDLLKTVTDAKGNVFKFDYDQNGNLVKFELPNNEEVLFEYTANGNIKTITNPEGQNFSATFDHLGNPQMISGPENTEVSFNFSDRNEVMKFTNSKGHQETLQYDALGRLTHFLDAVGGEISLNYDASGNLISRLNQDNEPVFYKYDASDRLKEIEVPYDGKIEFGYDGMDNLVRIKEPGGGVTNFFYNERNLLSSVIDPENYEINIFYDRAGNPITTKNSSGATMTRSYDKLNRVVAISDNEEETISVDYDVNGNIISYKNALGSTINLEYDELNRMKKITDAHGKSVGFSYNRNGRINGITDKVGNIRTYTYDALDRIKSFKDNLGGLTVIDHDSEGNILSLSDANNHTTDYTYDALGRIIKETFPDGKFSEYGYDNKGNITSFREKDGSFLSFTYDSLDRLATKTLPGGQIFSYTYDNINRLTEATNDAGTVTFTYDIMDRIISETFNGRTVHYDYDFNGKNESTTYPDGTIVTKNYDNRNRLISVQKNFEPIVTYQYNNADQVISQSYSNGVTTQYQYDEGGRIIALRSGDIQDMVFSYDDNGNITSIIRGDTDQSEFYEYDENNRLTNYKKGTLNGPYTIDDTYTYDIMGNRVSASIGGKNITYNTNSINQIESYNDGLQTVNFIYDDNGNLIFDGKYHKIYDAEKRVVKDSASPSEVITYDYDALGRRVRKTTNGIVSEFTFSHLSPIEQLDDNGNLIHKTIFTDYLTPIVSENNGVPYFYHQNHLLSVDALTTMNGELAEKYEYDVFGKQKIYDAAGVLLLGSKTGNQFGFTGQIHDSATSHIQFFFRTYNPETGLFNQQDLIGYNDGMAMYQYLGNNPVNGIDIFGLEKDPCKTTRDLKEERDKARLNSYKTLLKEIASKALEDGEKKYKLPEKYKHYKGTKKGIGVAASVVSLERKISDFSDNYNNMSEKDIQVEMTEISMDIAGLSADVGLLGKIPYVGPTASAVVNGYGKADTWSTILTGNSIPHNYAHLSDGAEERGRAMASNLNDKIDEKILWYDKYFDAVKKAQGTDETKWTEIAKKRWKKYKYLKNVQKTDRKPDCPPNQGSRKKPPATPPDKKKTSLVVSSLDPNEIIGPEGQPDLRWVSVDDRLPYTVTYENDAIATAPAKYVKIIVPAHEKMDPTSFHLSGIGFNDLTFEIPAGTTSSYRRLDATADLGLYVDMTAGYDITKNEFFWEFQSIDPETMMTPDDPMKGFLLLQDTTVEDSRNGHGFVTFSIKPMADAQTLDSILARADIVFDLNDTIPTNVEKNVIDAVAPTSHLSPLNENYLGSIPLSWAGVDDPNGSGVDYYSIYYSTDGTNFILWQDDMRRTDTVFSAPGDQRYFFFVLATDSVGNTEKMRANEVLNTYLNTNKVVPLTWLYFNGYNKEKDNILDWATTNEQQTKEFIVERSFDAVQFDPIGSVPASGNTTGNTSYSYTDHDIDQLGESIMYYRIAQVDLDGRSSYSNIIRLNYQGKKTSKTIVYPNPTKGIITLATTDESLLGTIAQVYDEAGKLLQSVKITSTNQQFNLNGYTNGIYFIQLANKEVMKVIKQ